MIAQSSDRIMRRNKARIPFVLQPGPAKGPDGKPLLYAQLDPTRKLSLNELELDIRGYANYSMGEFKRLFEVFAQLAGKYIAEGYRIVTPLGSFAPKLKMTLPATDPALVRNASASLAGVEFIPSGTLNSIIKEHFAGCEKLNTRVGNGQMYDPKAMDKALKNALETTGHITIKAFCYHSGLKRDSAKRFLDGLCGGQEPRLIRQKIGGTFVYSPSKRID